MSEAGAGRSRLWRVLENPLVWETSRIGLDLAFGLYRKRLRALREHGVLDGSPSVLDIGCGIGQYAEITSGKYVGVDMAAPYIEYARKRHRRPNQTFRCTDVTAVLDAGEQYDVVLMVDFLHHLSAEQCRTLLSTARRLARRCVASFEPITYQPRPLGRWIVEHDRGDHVRPLDELEALFGASGLEIKESFGLFLGPINTRVILARPKDES